MQGQRDFSTANSSVNADDFSMRRMLASICTAEPVTVVAVSGKGVAPVGHVDVLPLVNLVTGEGAGQRQSTQFKLPYQRVQGGKNALIIDPRPGDVGLAVYAMRDTETLKETRGNQPVNPASARSLDKGDGFYLGGFLNAAPERYVMVDDEGITVEGVARITTHGAETIINAERACTINAAGGCVINAAAGLAINGDVLINGSLTWTQTAQGQGGAARFQGGLTNTGGTVESNGIVLESHVHSGVEPGPGVTGGPQ